VVIHSRRKLNCVKILTGPQMNASKQTDSVLSFDFLVSDDYRIKHDQLAAGDGHRLHGKRLS
jgi:hypothetical protein